MSEKRFTDIGCSETGHIGVTDCGIDKEFTSDEFEDLLNELNDERMMYKTTIDKRIVELEEENEQLKQKIQRWKTLYEIKDKEVTARVDSLNKVCEYYTSEVLFKSDVDPNKAVQEVINEILNTEVKK